MLSFHTCPLATLGGKDTGGMNVYVRELVRALGRRGVGVDVFTRSQDEHVPHVLHHLGYGNRVVHVPAGPESPLDKAGLLQHLPAYVAGIRDFAARKGLRYDLLHGHYWLSGLAGLQLRSEWNVPLVQTFHTLGEMKNRVARSPEESASPGRLEGERRLMREAEWIVASTEAEVALFRWVYRIETDHVQVIEPGVDTARFYPIPADEAKEFIRLGQDRRALLFVGRIEPLKGLDSLLEALRLLKDRGVLQRHRLCLLVIGGEPDAPAERVDAEMARLKQLCRTLGIADAVEFLGRRDQDTLQYYYAAAEAVVMPSHYESFGLVALEAMACGTPVVASETGGLAFLVKDGETGFHVPTGDPAALADKLALLLEDEALADRLGAQAAEYARGFTWQKVAEQMTALYGELREEGVKHLSL
jgi:D-inositol-3-phosphate glycosyltransferase